MGQHSDDNESGILFEVVSCEVIDSLAPVGVLYLDNT